MSFPGEHASLAARSGNDPATHEETYGPIRLRRYLKEDGRTLILYTRGKLTQDGLAQDRPTQDGPAQDGPALDLPTQDRSSLE